MKPYYERGPVRLYHGDAREVLEQVDVGQVGLVLSDPPYGMAWKPWVGRPIANDGRGQALPLVEDVIRLTAPLLAPDAHAYLFCHWESWPGFLGAARQAFKLRPPLIWWKRRGGMGDTSHSYAPDYEVILHGIRARTRPLEGRRDGAVLDSFAPPHVSGRHHPTEKPLGLLRYLLGKSPPRAGEAVIDWFAGSGSTLVAAAELGHEAVGMEVDEAYCERAAKRLEATIASGADGTRETRPDPRRLGARRRSRATAVTSAQPDPRVARPQRRSAQPRGTVGPSRG